MRSPTPTHRCAPTTLSYMPPGAAARPAIRPCCTYTKRGWWCRGQPGTVKAEGQSLLAYQIPKIPVGGGLPSAERDRVPAYQTLATSEVPLDPQVIQITLPSAGQLTLWNNFDPLESGVGDFPPNLEDT